MLSCLVLLLCMLCYSHILLLALVIIVKYIGGVMIFTGVYSCSNANVIVHTSRGSFGYFLCAYIMQIRMLSSNTKNGEIERAFP
jgi:succinate-acetate transporter protein